MLLERVYVMYSITGPPLIQQEFELEIDIAIFGSPLNLKIGSPGVFNLRSLIKSLGGEFLTGFLNFQWPTMAEVISTLTSNIKPMNEFSCEDPVATDDGKGVTGACVIKFSPMDIDADVTMELTVCKDDLVGSYADFVMSGEMDG